MRRVLILIILLLATLRGVAQRLDCVMEHYSSLDGLPHNYIADIYQDRTGYLWLSTWYGLSRFDGYTFRNYMTLPGDTSPLSHNRILKVTEDAQGFLWVTTYDNHLYRFNRRDETFTEIPGSLDGYTDKNYKVESYLTAANGDVWLAITSFGLMRYGRDGRTQSWFGAKEIGGKVSRIFEASDGRIYVMSERGVVCFTGDEYKALLNERANDVIESGEKVYFAIQGGVFADGRTIHLPDAGDKATALAYSPDGGTIYIGTQREGVLRYDVAAGRLTADGYQTGRVRRLMCDSAGTLWIVTAQAGIVRYNGRNYRRFSQPMNTANYYVDSLARIVDDGSRVWVKMNGVGFGYYDRAADEIVPFHNGAGERYTNGVPCFMVDNSGVLWFSTTRRGLERVTFIESKAEVFAPSAAADAASHEIRAAMCDRAGRIWLANKSGELFCYDASFKLLHKFSALGQIYALFEDSKDNIWVGTKGNGVYKILNLGARYKSSEFRIQNSEFRITNYRHSADRTSINNDQVYSITEDRQGRIWFALYGGGVAMLPSADATEFVTPFNSFPNFPFEQGRRGRFVHCLADGTMLLGGVEGLLVFDPNEPADRMQFRLIQKIAGNNASLGNNDVIHIFTDSKGRTWLSTFGGGLNLIIDLVKAHFKVYSTDSGLSSNIIFAATEDREGNLWLSTENGISKFAPSSESFINLSSGDGIPPAIFSEATAIALPDGRVAFGTLENLYVVDPAAVNLTSESCRLTFTGFEVDNVRALAGTEFRMPYDYATFRIEFAALNFSLQSRCEYSYRLDGYDKDWTFARGERAAVYTNVSAGRYWFRVRAYVDGSYVEEASMRIVVARAPWRQWWAWALYCLAVGAIVFIVMRTIYAMLALRAKLEAEQRTRIQLLTAEQELASADDKFLHSVTRWLEKNIENPDITIEQLASATNMGRTTMYNRLKAISGKPPVEFINEYRMVRALQLLQSGEMTISEVAYRVGFSDPAYFSRRFKERYGVAPTKMIVNECQ